jgi:Family of unknown function (DUF6390)
MTVSLPGSVLFARYAYPPNELGYCGPEDAAGLLAAGAAGEASADIAARARQFDGAWVYLQLLAEAAGIDDPLDARVVEAYWIGGDLLDRLPTERLHDRLTERFAGQSGGFWNRLGDEARQLARAHHSFHVFAVYPWAGLLGSGSPVPLSVLDRCRIRWGQLVERHDETAVVRSQPLCWDGEQLHLGDEAEETVRQSSAGQSLADAQPGDWVALHFDWICDRLTPQRLAELTRASDQQLRLANLELRAASGLRSA